MSPRYNAYAERKNSGNGWMIAVAVLCLFLLAVSVFDVWFNRNYFVVTVVGDSMKNTVYDGDMLYAARKEAEHGDIVIINVTREEYQSLFQDATQRIIKRVIGLEGDEVRCENGVVFVRRAGEEHFVALEEPYAVGRTPDFGVVKVAEGEVFFLGDNRAVSHDSADVGCLLYSDIEGVVTDSAVRYKQISTSVEGLRAAVYNLFH